MNPTGYLVIMCSNSDFCKEQLLADCYKNSLAIAKDYKLESIAFPLVSSGAFGYLKDKALKTAISVIGDFLLSNEMTVSLVVYHKEVLVLSEKLFSLISRIGSFIS